MILLIVRSNLSSQEKFQNNGESWYCEITPIIRDFLFFSKSVSFGHASPMKCHNHWISLYLEFKPFFILSKSNHRQIKLANTILLSNVNGSNIRLISPWFLKNELNIALPTSGPDGPGHEYAWIMQHDVYKKLSPYLVAGDNILWPKVHARNDHEKSNCRDGPNGLPDDARRNLDWHRLHSR